MSIQIKVFNKGTRPVVFQRDRTGVKAIHPGKFLLFDPDKAKVIISKFDDACSKGDYAKHLTDLEKAREKEREKSKAEAETKKKDKEKSALEAKKKNESAS
jgi:hypothetical protein